LSADAGNMLYLPAGLAHGYCVPDGVATVLYFTTTVYAPEADAGIRWDSAGIAWPVKAPILSDRDRGLPALAEFESPFVYSAS
jgi:dTDP-4-dehydrorhamnose 3,5-epimerase